MWSQEAFPVKVRCEEWITNSSRKARTALMPFTLIAPSPGTRPEMRGILKNHIWNDSRKGRGVDSSSKTLASKPKDLSSVPRSHIKN